MANYYVAVNGQPVGPYTIEQLANMNLTPKTLVWTESMPNWTEAATVVELQPLFSNNQPKSNSVANYYLAVNGQPTGPFTIEQLTGMHLLPQSLVWTESMPNWTEAATVVELQPLFSNNQQSYQQPYQQPYQQQGPVYQRTVGFGEAIKLFFSNYTNFYGRSSRSEYWFAVLFNFIISLTINISGIIIFSVSSGSADGLTFSTALGWIYSFIVFIPNLAISWRPLHDIGKSGAWYFTGLIPFIGWVILIIWFCTKSDPYENEYGPVPNTVSEY